MNTKTLMIARHPETTSNVEGRWVGRGEAEFTERGRLQSGLLVERIVEFEPEAIWSSPSGRARIPATGAGEMLGITVSIDERFCELDLGDAEGYTLAEAHEVGIDFDFTSEDRPVARGGESRRAVAVRAAQAVEDALGDSDRLTVVTHGGVLRSVLVSLLGLSAESIWAFDVRNALTCVIEIGEFGTESQWSRLIAFRQIDSA